MQKISRSDAKEQGLTRYFTGKPCKHGHVVDRMVSSGACMACKGARNKEWNGKNRDKESARSAEWVRNNPDKRKINQDRYAANNRELQRERQRTYRANNPDKIKAKNARWLAANRERLAQMNADWYRENRDKVSARDMRRRAGFSLAKVDWDDELTSLVVIEAANLAILRESATGFKWHIDHMVPIKCRKASGLHVWSNLQVIPGSMNASKNNKFILTAPGEWIRAL